MSTESSPPILEQLLAVIQDRRVNPPQRSYTTTLFEGGTERIGEKVVEEAAEVIEAAAKPGPGGTHLVHEAADLIYHLLVLLVYKEITWNEVETELARRFGICGLDEKDART